MMRSHVRLYFAVLAVIIAGWLFLKAPTWVALGESGEWPPVFGFTAVYLCSHVFRLLRLAVLTLDERARIWPLMLAHVTTSFPNSVLPFKTGEVLRLASFFEVYDGRRKACAVWLAERLGDAAVIACFVLALYLFKVDVPASMRWVLIVFVLVAGLIFLGLFAVAKVFVYLNRHLVLTSLSRRGLWLLRASHQLRSLEREISATVEGRLSGLLLLSVLIWSIEITALSMFIHHVNANSVNFASLFVSGLLASLPGGFQDRAVYFGQFQSLGLGLLTFLFLALSWSVSRHGTRRS